MATRGWEKQTQEGLVVYPHTGVVRVQTMRESSRRLNKYNAKPVVVNGQRFDSTGEKNRYQLLRLRELAGNIHDLRLHPHITLVKGRQDAKEIAYKPDYSYVINGIVYYEDWKPRPLTSRDRLIFKLWEHFGPGTLLITGKPGTIKEIDPCMRSMHEVKPVSDEVVDELKKFVDTVACADRKYDADGNDIGRVRPPGPEKRKYRMHSAKAVKLLPNGLTNPGYCKPLDVNACVPVGLVSDVIQGRGFITRNSRCPCGSGKRFKKCCMVKK